MKFAATATFVAALAMGVIAQDTNTTDGLNTTTGADSNTTTTNGTSTNGTSTNGTSSNGTSSNGTHGTGSNSTHGTGSNSTGSNGTDSAAFMNLVGGETILAGVLASVVASFL